MYFSTKKRLKRKKIIINEHGHLCRTKIPPDSSRITGDWWHVKCSTLSPVLLFCCCFLYFVWKEDRHLIVVVSQPDSIVYEIIAGLIRLLLLGPLHSCGYQWHTAGPDNSQTDNPSQQKACQLTCSHTGSKTDIHYFNENRKKGRYWDPWKRTHYSVVCSA